MYFDKLELILNNLIKANIFGFRTHDNIYHTNHNELNVEMSHHDMAHYNLSLDNNEYMFIKFKDKSNNEIFTLSYQKQLKNTYYKQPGNKYFYYLNMFISNAQLDDKNMIAELLKKIDFDSFLDKEIINSANAHQNFVKKIEEENKNKQFEMEKIANNLILKLDEKSSTTITNLNQIKDIIVSVNKSEVKDLFTKEFPKDINASDPNFFTEDIYKENFNGFDVTYKKINSYKTYNEEDKATISFVNKDKDISFEIVFNAVDYSSFLSKELKHEYFYIKVGEQNIVENNLIIDILNKSGAIDYFNSLSDKVNKLNESQIAQENLSGEVSKKFASIKAQRLLNKLSNDDINDLSSSNITTIDINGCKVWVNENGKIHREDGPAIENYNGAYFWFKNGEAYIPNEKSEIYFYNCSFIPKNNELLVKDLPSSFTITSASINNETSVSDDHHKNVSNLVSKFRKMFSLGDNKKPKNKL